MSLINDPSNFKVTTTIEEQDTVIALRGRIENLAAFNLGASLDATIDRHPTSVVLDLAELEFMGAAGIVAVANAEKRLADEGIKLLVRSPSDLVNRLLDMLGSAEDSRLERSFRGHAHLGPEELTPETTDSVQFISSLSTQDLSRTISMPTDPDVIDGALGLVVELAQSCVSGADGVSVSLFRHSVLSTVAATDETIVAMDAGQYATGEGTLR